ncbi:hypothetical protein HP062_25595 [Pseudomonas sp. B14-6]|jgi:hypothetical protein|uniref:hypothetical protein n=1 Tax=unclassified Pseudomonas TaxID=196821 RepID=UPI00098ABC72|nr:MULTISPECIES: hypothetical protein [unclassified Pseudomonas]MBU0520830.1 hypothetical protein [Gammaproteobacteria bacterium]MBU1840246.1 hypothetical protein [Gammaproteobacteria bacterium]OOL39934.1 hypothetical protein BOO94_03055 [Pseudomonas sp. FSL W5-0299]QKG68700.1 hypothetical protein HP062_25595 [Pseudomonas sp. B14-6]
MSTVELTKVEKPVKSPVSPELAAPTAPGTDGTTLYIKDFGEIHQFRFNFAVQYTGQTGGQECMFFIKFQDEGGYEMLWRGEFSITGMEQHIKKITTSIFDTIVNKSTAEFWYEVEIDGIKKESHPLRLIVVR